MNIEKFHNELAMRLGYECIVKDKRLSIFVDETDNPSVILTSKDGETIRINASTELDDAALQACPDMQDEMKAIAKAAHQAYIQASKCFYEYPIK